MEVRENKYALEFEELVKETARILEDECRGWQSHPNRRLVIILEGVQDGITSEKMLRASREMYVDSYIARKCTKLMFTVFRKKIRFLFSKK